MSAVADAWNIAYPVGTRVAFWPGLKLGDGRPSRTRTPAWDVGDQPCVSVDGYAGGIALTHVEVTP